MSQAGSDMTGILLVSAIKRYRLTMDLEDAIIKSSTEQFKVRIMVILLALFGLLPAALNTGIGSDVQRPLATVIIGGLTSTLLFTPLIIPSLYYWLEKPKK